jgi:phosphatidylglycerol:prolipoprotein diacylglycerol transferase
MIEINIDPTMIILGPVAITWHGFFTAVGLFAGMYLSAYIAPRVGVAADHILNGTPWAVVFGIIGARLFHVADNWPLYAPDPMRIITGMTEGGIAIYGAVVGGIIGGYLYALKNKVNVPPFADAAVIGLLLGQGIGRLGDIINGEHHGRPLDAWYSVAYTHPLTLGQPGLPVHLAVGYEMALDFIGVGILLWLFGRVRPGTVFFLYIAIYSAIRLLVGFYRIDNVVAFGLGQAQIISVIGLLACVPLAYWWATRPGPDKCAQGDLPAESGA